MHVDDGDGSNQNLFLYLLFATFWSGRIFRWEEESVMLSGTKGPGRHVWSLKLSNSPVILSFRNNDFGLLQNKQYLLRLIHIFCHLKNPEHHPGQAPDERQIFCDVFDFERCTSSHRRWQLCSWFWKPEQNQREGHMNGPLWASEVLPCGTCKFAVAQFAFMVGFYQFFSVR